MQYTITLNRAHKIVERLRQHVTDTSKAVRALVAPVRVRSQQDAGAKARAEAHIQGFDAQFAEYGLAGVAVEKLRNAISKANTAHGIDVLLAKQNRINQELTLAKDLVSDASLDECVSWEHVAAAPGDYQTENLGPERFALKCWPAAFAAPTCML